MFISRYGIVRIILKSLGAQNTTMGKTVKAQIAPKIFKISNE
jgi:hypothetical protein